jgi:hypothetical protein
MIQRKRITPLAGARRKSPVNLLAVAILCFAGVRAEAAEIHDGDIGYVANNSIWFSDEADLSVWKRVRKAFAAKDVNTYQKIILEERPGVAVHCRTAEGAGYQLLAQPARNQRENAHRRQICGYRLVG